MKPNAKSELSSADRLDQDASSLSAQHPVVSDELQPLAAEELGLSQDTRPSRGSRPVWRRTFGVTILGVGILAGILLAVHEVSLNKQQAALNANQASESLPVKSQTIPLNTLGLQPLSTLSQVNALTVNGNVDVNNSLLLTPMPAPIGAVAGQMYFDQQKNQVGYYNGSSFVYLQGGSASVTNNVTNVKNVNNISNVTNDINNITNNNGTTGITAINGTAGSLAMFDGVGGLTESLVTQTGSNLSTGTGVENVTIGSTSGASTTVVQGGTGNVAINTGNTTGSSGSITIESGTSSTTTAGNVTIDTGGGVISGTLIADKTFEDGTDNMGDATYGDNSTVTQTTAQAHGGTHSLSVAVGSNFFPNWSIGDGGSNPPYIIPVSAGHTYAFSAWVRADTNSDSITASVIWSSDGYGGGGEVSQQTFGTVTDITTGWRQVAGVLTAPVGAYEMGFYFSANDAQTVGEVHYFDDMTVTDLSSSTSASALNIGTTNAQVITIGNSGMLAPTNIYGGGVNLNGGTGFVNISGSNLTATSGGASYSTTSGALDITAATSSTWKIGGSNYGGGDLSVQAGDAGGNNNGGNLVLAGGAGAGTGSSGSVIVNTPTDSTSVFSVQNASGSNLINVDSTNSIVSLGGDVSTFGYATIGASDESGNSQWLEAQKISTTNSGELNSISVFFGAADSAPNNVFAAAIYSDSGTACNGGAALASCPGTMIASSSNTVLTSYAWNTATINAALAANTSYWIVINTYASAGNLNNTYGDVNPSYDYASDSGVALGSWPAFGNPTFTSHAAISMYASITTGSDGSALATNANGDAVVGGGAQTLGYALTVNSPGTGTGALYLQGTETINAINPYALQVAATGGGNIFDVDSQNDRVLIGGLDTHWGGAYSDATLDVRAEAHAELFSGTDAGGNPIFSVGADGSTQITTSTDSVAALVVQNSLGSSQLSVDTVSNLVSVTNLVATGTLTVDGHFISGGSTPAIAADAAACASPSTSVSGNDTSGTITVTTGTGCASSGSLATITFASAFGAAPHVVVTPGALNAAGLNAYVDDSSVSTMGFVLGSSTTPAPSTTYKWNYFVVQ